MTRDFDIVIYHGNCPDGFTGAWAFWEQRGKDAEYLPYRYGKDPPDVTGKTVAIVDFSFPRDVLVMMASQAKYLVVLDHHKSAERELDDLKLDNCDIIFDMDRSGAQIAWDYLNKEPRPWFVDYVADRDLWRHELPMTREISEALFFDGYYGDFEKLHGLFMDRWSIGERRAELAERGKVLLEYKNKESQNYANSAKPTVLTVGDRMNTTYSSVADGGGTPSTYRVNLAACPRMYRSDVGNIICSTQVCDFAGVYWYDFYTQEWWVSFRAANDSPIDLSKITSLLPNGGGHPKAAGFTIYGSKGEDLYTYFSLLDKNIELW